MKKYSFAAKGSVLVTHQLMMILSFCSLYAGTYSLGEGESIAIQYIFLAAFGLLGGFLALIFLTNAAGKKGRDLPAQLSTVDYWWGDICFLVVAAVLCYLMHLMLHLDSKDFHLSGLFIGVGTLTYLFDSLFLALYLSLVRRYKCGSLLTQTFCYWLGNNISQSIQSKKKKEGWYWTRAGKEGHRIQLAIEAIAQGDLSVQLEESQFHGSQREMARAVNSIGQGMKEAVARSLKDERMKADLITNVSHDLKTPLTSIVNYVDLLKRQDLQNPDAQRYLAVIDEKSQRLKNLTEDLVEISKISSGNIKLECTLIDFVELLYQTGGEFDERFEKRKLTVVTKLPKQAVPILADGRQLYRVIENLYTNAAKYALEGTNVYVELTQVEKQAVFSIKNLVENPFPDTIAEEGAELTERFVRGEVSRHTEGSGLGLSIAKTLTQLMGGNFAIQAKGDQFCASLSFPVRNS